MVSNIGKKQQSLRNTESNGETYKLKVVYLHVNATGFN